MEYFKIYFYFFSHYNLDHIPVVKDLARYNFLTHFASKI